MGLFDFFKKKAPEKTAVLDRPPMAVEYLDGYPPAVKMAEAARYNWGELDVYSRTRFDCCEEAMAPMMAAKAIDIDPDDIDVSDTATFVWEIK